MICLRGWKSGVASGYCVGCVDSGYGVCIMSLVVLVGGSWRGG